MPELPKPRDYQFKLIEEARRSMSEEGHKKILIQLPTGGGKGVIIGYIGHSSAIKGHRILVLTHRREIARQLNKHMYSFGLTCGQILSGVPPMPVYPIQIAMIGTLIHRIHTVKKPTLILVDEAHHIVSPTWKKIIQYWGMDIPVIGFTATPIRLDGKGLGGDGLFTKIVEGKSIRWLVKNGFLSYPIMYRHPNEIKTDFKVKNGDYDKEEQAVVFSRGTVLGDVLEHYRKYLDGKPTVAFCPTVEHSKLTAQMFSQAGYRAVAVYGNMGDKERDDAIAGLADGRVQIITSCDVISEGMDVPGIVGCILLRRTLSLSLYLQQTGRALRPAPGKDHAIILDHAGNYKIHGHILDEREWSLDGMPKKDKKPTPKMTECPKCYAIWEGLVKKCLSCGYDFPKIEIPKEEAKFTIIKGELVAEFPDLEDELLDVAAKALAKQGKERSNDLWSQAHKLLNQGEAGRIKLDRITKAMGYKDSFSRVVWEHVKKQRGMG